MSGTPNNGLLDTVADYRLECRARRLAPKTIRWYEQKLEVICARLAAQGVTTAGDLKLSHIHRLLADLDDGTRSSYTVRGYTQVAKGWLHFLEDEDLVDLRVRARLKLPRVAKRLIKTLDADSQAALFDATRHQSMGWLRVRDRAILSVLLETGVRASELTGLRRCDVDLDDDPHIRVIGKGDKEREVGPLSVACVRACRRYLRAIGPLPPLEPFFLSRYHQRLTVGGLDQLLYRLRDAAGLEGVEVRAHVFRHTCARRWLTEGYDIKRISLLMGHTSVVVTEGYLRDFQQREARRPVQHHS